MLKKARRTAIVMVLAGSSAGGCGDDGARGDTTSPSGTATTGASVGGTSGGGPGETGTPTTAPTGETGVAATGDTSTGEALTGSAGSTGSTGEPASTGDATTGGSCLDILPMPVGPEAVLADEYKPYYQAYDLGAVPKQGGGVLPRLGGLVIAPDDPLLAYVIGPSEVPEAQLHSIVLERGPCGHIIGFKGEAQPVLMAPYLDLMVNGPKGIVFVSHYPTAELSQYVPGQVALASTIDLAGLGMEAIHSPGGINFVPPGYPEAGQLRIAGFNINHNGTSGWYRATIEFTDPAYAITKLSKTVDIPNGPGGFAYIPIGSPLFPEQRIIMTEWDSVPQAVSSFAVDAAGDPIPATRKGFFTSFVKPWGSYFEPETGDYIFLQWENQPDHVYIVQGFVPPPPLPG
ncbi:hypothetical protein [Nannocystis sp.]|uniref:hypothetical protein n=1 Tax=Nannocystis sp. TaxID=1962667 RepID=UPI0025E7CD4D|nr:hypothetical protein [Nannocystis sp.]MBK7828446.1 hypothetical protein [Nannocystis sp.]